MVAGLWLCVFISQLLGMSVKRMCFWVRVPLYWTVGVTLYSQRSGPGRSSAGEAPYPYKPTHKPDGLIFRHPKTLTEVSNITNTGRNVFEMLSLSTATPMLERKADLQVFRTPVPPPSDILCIKTSIVFYVFVVLMQLQKHEICWKVILNISFVLDV